MSSTNPHRRSAIDTLIARDRTAVFWFLAACLTAGSCAWFVTQLSTILSMRPDFIVMDTSGAYYVPPGKIYSQMDRMHEDLNRYAVETLLTRNREGLVYEDRLAKICTKSGLQAVRKYLALESEDFRTQQIEQIPEYEAYEILVRTRTEQMSLVQGEVQRRGTFKGREQTERYRFKIKIVWLQNLGIAKNAAFPSLIKNMQVTELEKITEL